MRTMIAMLLVLAPFFATAATVTRCVDAAGKVTFSQHGCPDSAVNESTVAATNSAPSGSGPAVRMNSDTPSQGFGGVRVSGTGPAPGEEPAVAPVPRQENTPMRKAVPYQKHPSNCVRWVDKMVQTPRGPVMQKVSVPCG